MSYQHEHIPLFDPVTGYTAIATHYKKHHTRLSGWDAQAITRYLPRSLAGMHVLDIGGGDGRWAVRLKPHQYASRTILDISQAMLDCAPAWTEKICVDVRDLWPTPAATYDLLLCTFVLLHLDAIDSLFHEARRCVSPTGSFLLFHHEERRPFVHETTTGPMKIKTRHRQQADIQQGLAAAGWHRDLFTIDSTASVYSCFPSS